MAEQEDSGPVNQDPSQAPAPAQEAEGRWERDLVRDLAFSTLREMRRARRWRIFFRILTVVVVVGILIVVIPSEVPIGPHTGLVRVNGVIMEEAHANAENINGALRAAFRSKGTRGIILQANSPGGSPVQAGYIYDEIRRLRQEHPDVPVYAVVTDVCASACYYIVSAADKIYANRASLVGSIGVLYNGFGYTELIDKIGVERRLLTAGENKAMMDPFSPLDPGDVAHFQRMLDQIHEQFIQAVRDGRGDRLGESEELFSGLVWTGERGVDLGLVDDLASPNTVAREVIGEDEVIDYTPRIGPLERLSGAFGAEVGKQLVPQQRLR